MNLDFKRTNETWQEFRRRVSRLASVANKRLDRIEKNDVTQTPAFQAVTSYKGERPKFGVKGKSNNQVIQEFWRLKKFLDARTSTISGIKSVIKEAEQNTGTKFIGNLSSRVIQAGDYFKIVDVITDYLKNIEMSAQALNYNAIFNTVSSALKKDKHELANLRNDGAKLRELFSSVGSQLKISLKQDVANQLANEFERRITI